METGPAPTTAYLSPSPRVRRTLEEDLEVRGVGCKACLGPVFRSLPVGCRAPLAGMGMGTGRHRDRDVDGDWDWHGDRDDVALRGFLPEAVNSSAQ